MTNRISTSAFPLLQDPFFVLCLVLLWAGVGRRVLQWLRAPGANVSALERGVLACGLGSGLTQYLAFGLGAVGLLSSRAVGIGLLVLFALFATDMLAVLRGIVQAVQRRKTAPPQVWLQLGLVALAVPVLIGLLVALCPPVDSDTQSYHLNAAKRWLEAGRLVALPTLTPTYWPMGVQMQYTLALAVWSDTAAQLIHFALGLLATLTVFTLGRRLANETVGFLAAYGFLIAVPKGYLFSLLMSLGATVDLGVTFQFLCALLAWFLWRQTRGAGWLWSAALCAGFAASFKLTGVFVGVVLAALTLFERRGEGQAFGKAARGAIAFFAVSVLPLLPWLARSAVLTGNLVYPMFGSVIPTRDWTPGFGVAFDHWYKFYNWGWTHPEWSLEKRRKLCLMAMAALVGGTTLLGALWRNRDARVLLTLVGALGFGCLWTTGLYLRYMLPLLPLVYLLLLLPFARLLDSAGWMRFLVPVAVLGSSLLFVKEIRGRLHGAVSAVTSRSGREAYLQSVPLMPLWNALNALPPDHANVLLGGFYPAFSLTGGLSYYSARYCYVTDACLQARLRLDTWEHFVADVRREHIGYLLAPLTDQVNQAVTPDYLPARNELPFARRLANEYGFPLYARNEIGLYRLDFSAR